MRNEADRQFPYYDEETDSIRLQGQAHVLLAILSSGKFGERFDPMLLLNRQLAGLIRELKGAVRNFPVGAGGGFSNEDMLLIAERVVSQSMWSGWWQMDHQERYDYLQDVAAPHVLSDGDIEAILYAMDSFVSDYRQIADAADNA